MTDAQGIVLALAALFLIYLLGRKIARAKAIQAEEKRRQEEAARQRQERIAWVRAYGSPEEKIALELEFQNEQLRRLGQTQAMHNLTDTFDRH